MSVTEDDVKRWQEMRAPTLRKLVKEQHGEALNGGLMIAKKQEMIDVLSGSIRPEQLITRLKQRATRRANGHERPESHHKRPAGTVARATRRAASPVPPALPTRVQDQVNGFAAKLSLASALAELPAVVEAPAEQLRAAVEALIAIRG